MKTLGKIGSISLGMGGYQDVMFGVTIALDAGYCCTDFKGAWLTSSAPKNREVFGVEEFWRERPHYSPIIRL